MLNALVDEEVEERAQRAHFKVDGARGDDPAFVLLARFSTNLRFARIRSKCSSTFWYRRTVLGLSGECTLTCSRNLDVASEMRVALVSRASAWIGVRT